ncbi:MAG: transposase [Chlamydiae bacterium]|nr:transposase [Chlamydiota bacterium]
MLLSELVINLNTHHKPSVYDTFEPSEAKRIADRFTIQCTPKHGSWLNRAEIELSHLSWQCLDRRLGEEAILAEEVRAWTKERSENQIIANWQFRAADATV